MDTFDKWFSRFMWGTDIVFLVASMPHIAAWFAHFDNPTDFWSGIYAWSVGFGLAVAIDGVSFMLLLAITRMIKQGKTKNGWVMFGLFAFMSFIALLSWGINWQYDTQFASDAFQKADAVHVIGTITVGSINPIIGGAFQVLILAYALIGKAMQGEVKPVKAMSEAEFEEQRRALLQKKALKELSKTDDDTGLFAKGKERIFGKEKDAEKVYQERLNAATDYMRNATDLLDRSQEKKAVELLAVFLKVSKKEALVYLEAVRPILLKEKEAIAEEKTERITGPLANEFSEELGEESEDNSQENSEQFAGQTDKSIAIPADVVELINQYPKAASLLDTSTSTIAIVDVAAIFNRTPVLIKNRADAGRISYVKGRKKVYKNSVIEWAKEEMIVKGNRKIIGIETARNPQEENEEIQSEKVSG